MIPRLLSAAFLGLLVLQVAPAEESRAGGAFTRFVEDDAGARLQTAAASYRNKNGVTVDLIGAIHIADKAYYDKLNLRFTRYQVLLYEMVGETIEQRIQWHDARTRIERAEPRALEEAPVEEDRKQIHEADRERVASDRLSWLHPLYDTMAGALGLTGQMDGIDYSGRNFVHADMSARQFALMQRQKNESFLSLWWKTVVVQMEHPEVIPEQPGMLQILEVLCRKDSSTELRRLIGRMFGSIEGLLSGIESEQGTVILAERNKVALAVLREQIKLGRKNLAIFYGAAHLPDMEKRLVAMGFERVGGEWFTAWELPPPPPAPKAAVER